MAKKGNTGRIVQGVVAGFSRAQVAKMAGISERTLRRRLAEDAVLRAEIAEARAEAHSQMLGRLTELSHRALDEIEFVLDDGSERGKLSAARLVLASRHSQLALYEDALRDRDVAAELAEDVEAGLCG